MPFTFSHLYDIIYEKMREVYNEKKILALLMVTLLCVGCLPIENQLFNISFDGHDDAYEFEETRYKPGQKVVVYFTAIGTDTDYKFFTNGVEIAAEYESEKGYTS